MLQSTIDSLEYTIKSCESLCNKEDLLKENDNVLKEDIKKAEDYLTFIKGAKEKYTIAVNELYEESIKALKDTLNTALKYIIYDKNYGVKLDLEDKRGTKLLSIIVVDEDNDNEAEFTDGVGNGIRTIISFVLKSYYLLNQNCKVLFLDEKYSYLSDHYIPRFYDFMKKFCEEHDFIIVMISHIDNQIEQADRTYYINDGIISLSSDTTQN